MHLRKLCTRVMLVVLLFCLVGCGTFGTTPVILTSSDQIWFLKEGTDFASIGPRGAVEVVNAPEDLIVLYKGRYLELEDAAGVKSLSGKKQGIVGRILGFGK